MNWTTIKKSFRLSLTVNMTTTKLLAWAMFIMTWYFATVIPMEAIAYFIMGMSTIIVFLYTGKMIQEYKTKSNDK